MFLPLLHNFISWSHVASSSGFTRNSSTFKLNFLQDQKKSGVRNHVAQFVVICPTPQCWPLSHSISLLLNPSSKDSLFESQFQLVRVMSFFTLSPEISAWRPSHYQSGLTTVNQISARKLDISKNYFKQWRHKNEKWISDAKPSDSFPLGKYWTRHLSRSIPWLFKDECVHVLSKTQIVAQWLTVQLRVWWLLSS